MLRAAWNLFGLTGSIEEYMLVKEIEKSEITTNLTRKRRLRCGK